MWVLNLWNMFSLDGQTVLHQQRLHPSFQARSGLRAGTDRKHTLDVCLFNVEM